MSIFEQWIGCEVIHMRNNVYFKLVTKEWFPFTRIMQETCKPEGARSIVKEWKRKMNNILKSGVTTQKVKSCFNLFSFIINFRKVKTNLVIVTKDTFEKANMHKRKREKTEVEFCKSQVAMAP